MKRSNLYFLALLMLAACSTPQGHEVDREVMAALGESIKNEFAEKAEEYRTSLSDDPLDVENLMGFAESEILLYVFGYFPREETLPEAREAFHEIHTIDPLASNTLKLSGVLNFLDWKWNEAETDLLRAIDADPCNLNARHWYSLYLSAMGRFDEAIAQSDTIATMDTDQDYLIGRGSLFYFARRNEELKDLMIRAVARDSAVAWGYDWLGMAYIELGEYENSLKTYKRAFELADGTVEVGAGYGHALGLAGEYEAAKRMADYYETAAREHYLPPVQRAFIHIGIGEYDKAIHLLEQACEEKSWFLEFMQVEPWLDPLREDNRFKEIMKRMEFPE